MLTSHTIEASVGDRFAVVAEDSDEEVIAFTFDRLGGGRVRLKLEAAQGLKIARGSPQRFRGDRLVVHDDERIQLAVTTRQLDKGRLEVEFEVIEGLRVLREPEAQPA